MNTDVFDELEKWYISNYKDTSNFNKISITTVENPGWWFEANLIGTPFENKTFNNIKILKSEHVWISSFIREKKFEGASGPLNLGDLIACFVYAFVQDVDITEKLLQDAFLAKDSPWYEFQKWRLSQCDEVWEQDFGARIYTLHPPGWHVEIDIEATELEDKDYIVNEVLSKKGIHCRVERMKFIGEGSPLHLTNIIEEFVRWKKE